MAARRLKYADTLRVAVVPPPSWSPWRRPATTAEVGHELFEHAVSGIRPDKVQAGPGFPGAGDRGPDAICPRCALAVELIKCTPVLGTTRMGEAWGFHRFKGG
jgi:hypothetical protein